MKFTPRHACRSIKFLLCCAAALMTVPSVLAAQDDQSAAPKPYPPPPGSNQVLRAPITASPELEVIVSDVVIPPGATVPRHFHPGEEFVYVIEGSAVHVEEGKPDRTLGAGDSLVIPPRAVHAPRAGESGARAIVFRVHLKGEPERIPVE